MPRQPASSPSEADFGFRRVPEADKPALVRALFDSVARRYDLMNDLMSGGVHRLWKDALVDRLNPRPGERFLDVAGGTGDVARRIAARLGGAARETPVRVVDMSPGMIAEGRRRALDHGLVHEIDWICGDAERLPLPSRSFDAYTIAFGIRNTTHIDRVLAEAQRVLKTGGRFLCLEFSPAVAPPLAPLYELYSFRVLPLLGAWVQNDRPAYEYLAESIRRFPAPAAFAALIEEAGFGRVAARRFCGGIAVLHSAWRI